MDDDFFGGDQKEDEVRKRIASVEFEVKKQQMDNLGYQSGLVTSLEKAEQEATRQGIKVGFDSEYQQAYEHGKLKAAEMLKHLQ